MAGGIIAHRATLETMENVRHVQMGGMAVARQEDAEAGSLELLFPPTANGQATYLIIFCQPSHKKVLEQLLQSLGTSPPG